MSTEYAPKRANVSHHVGSDIPVLTAYASLPTATARFHATPAMPVSDKTNQAHASANRLRRAPLNVKKAKSASMAIASEAPRMNVASAEAIKYA